MEAEQKAKSKINFLKKIWYSITKPSKYTEMREQGLGKAIKYFLLIISLLAIILAIVATILQVNVVNDAISELDNKLPEMKFKDNQLTTDTEEVTILDDDQFKEYFGNAVVINPLLERTQAIDEYYNLATDKNNVIVFLNDQYVIISNKYNPAEEKPEGIESYTYADVSKNYIKDSSIEYSKKDIIEYLRERVSYTYYGAQFFTIYFVSLALLYGLYILIIAGCLWLVTKITKFKWNFKDTLMNTIYASTLSIIAYVIYMICGNVAKIRIPYADVISILLVFIYIFLLLLQERKNKEGLN